MKKQWLYIGAVALVVAAALFIGGQVLPHSTNSVNTNTAVQTNVTTQVKTEIDNGTSKQTYSYTPLASESALALLERIAKDKGITLDLKHYSFGDLVNGINGVMGNDATGFYWSFYVNGKMSDVGAGSYTLKAGDAIAWRYQKL